MGKKSSFYFLLLVSSLSSQTFSSYNYEGIQFHHYNKIPQARLTFISQTNNYTSSGRTRSGFSCSIRPNRQIPAYSEWSNDSVECSNASPELSDILAEWFQEYFQGINPVKIFREYKQYKFSGFRAFIKTLVFYKKH